MVQLREFASRTTENLLRRWETPSEASPRSQEAGSAEILKATVVQAGWYRPELNHESQKFGRLRGASSTADMPRGGSFLRGETRLPAPGGAGVLTSPRVNSAQSQGGKPQMEDFRLLRGSGNGFQGQKGTENYNSHAGCQL